jgi:hypothetical protein
MIGILFVALLAAPAAQTGDTIPAPQPDLLVQSDFAPTLRNVFPDRFERAGPSAGAAEDTVRKRPKAVEYSDFYYTRAKIHKIASFAMLPLFVAQYAAGQELFQNGNDAAQWAKDLHAPLAATIGGLWVLNTVTGAWNYWDSRHVKEGRTRRLVHGLLMTVAGAGFVAVGATAPESEGNYTNGDPSLHKGLAIGSMAVATASWLMMIIWK